MIYTEIDSRPATFSERFAMIAFIWTVLYTMKLNGETIPFKVWFFPIREYIFKMRPMVSDYIVNRNGDE